MCHWLPHVGFFDLIVLGGCPKYALLRFRAKRFTPIMFKCFLSRRSSVLMLSCLTTLTFVVENAFSKFLLMFLVLLSRASFLGSSVEIMTLLLGYFFRMFAVVILI